MRAVLMLLVVAGCAGDPVRICTPQKYVDVPLSLSGDLPTLPVLIDGQTAMLVLDTGGVTTVVTDTAARRLGLAPDPGRTSSFVGAAGVSLRASVRARTLAVGGISELTLNDVGLSVIGVSGADRFDGLLGMNVFRQLDLDFDIDQPRRRVSFYRGSPCDRPPPGWTSSRPPLPARRDRGGHFVVDVTLGGRPFSALVDTGAETSTITPSAARRLGLSAEELALNGRPVRISGAGTASIMGSLYRFGTLTVAGEDLPRRLLLVAPLPMDVDMILGADYLNGRRVWLSAALGQVWFGDDESPPGP